MTQRVTRQKELQGSIFTVEVEGQPGALYAKEYWDNRQTNALMSKEADAEKLADALIAYMEFHIAAWGK